VPYHHKPAEEAEPWSPVFPFFLDFSAAQLPVFRA
jgi:hypothetical protein